MDLLLNDNKIVIPQETEGSKFGKKRTYVNAGISNYRITELRDWNDDEKAKSRQKKSFVLMVLTDMDSGAVHSERLYMGETSKSFSIAKLSHIVSVLCPDMQLGDVSTEKLAEVLVGKEGRFKINGEECISLRTNKPYIRATNFPRIYRKNGKIIGFCEPLDQNPSELTFDKNNPFDVRPLEGTTSKPVTAKEDNFDDLFGENAAKTGFAEEKSVTSPDPADKPYPW